MTVIASSCTFRRTRPKLSKSPMTASAVSASASGPRVLLEREAVHVSDHTSTTAPVARVVATQAALGCIERLVVERGPVMFFQSGGCCDSSLPLCFDEGGLVVSEQDVLLGRIGGCP
jgi:hypothetical protein